MNKVEVIEASRTNFTRRTVKGVQVERIRVAAYCRVSTDDDDQLGSFESQKVYYEEKIKSNLSWVNAGIFADEAITGTKVKKRDDFLAMIQKCLEGEIDLILTKSISRFARNTLDTLQYVRMLRERNIAVYFEKENINTLDMNGELLLTIMSSLAQQEVESLSQNVKMGLKMKMKRGELCGFHGCLGYDYDYKTKTLSINEEEADTVRIIFEMYLQGYGATTIAHHLTKLGKKNKKGNIRWHESGIRGVIRNEKYTGDILLGKTFTLDPISKRRLTNHGEEEQYFIRDHHEAIVTREIWEQANRIRIKRGENVSTPVTGVRERFTRLYAFSSMCECAFCGKKLVRKVLHSGSKHKKVAWQCVSYAKHGVKSCSKCKAINEEILENAFVEAFNLLAGNFNDVTEIVIKTFEQSFYDNDLGQKLQKVKNEITNIKRKKSRLTDMLIEGSIEKEDCTEKFREINRKLSVLDGQRIYLEEVIDNQKNIELRINELRKMVGKHNSLDSFDRAVFECIIDRVIVGGYNENGIVDPYKITFVMKGDQSAMIPDAKNHFKMKQV